MNQLLFWECEWYIVFREMRGRMPTFEIALGRRRYKQVMARHLQKLKALQPAKRSERRLFRQMAIADIENELRPRKPASNPSLWKVIVNASTGDEVRKALEKKPVHLHGRKLSVENWHWCGRTGYAGILRENADQFAASKDYIYYPKGRSIDADKKRVLYFARAMAGITCGLSPVTGWDRLYRLKREHGKDCSCVFCTEKTWERIEQLFLKPLIEVNESNWEKMKWKS